MQPLSSARPPTLWLCYDEYAKYICQLAAAVPATLPSQLAELTLVSLRLKPTSPARKLTDTSRLRVPPPLPRTTARFHHPDHCC